MATHSSVSQILHENLSKLIAGSAPGERLPSEPQLAQQLGVSRATLREAMRTFETQGLIRRKQGAGTFVMQLPSSIITSGLEVLESIESMAERSGLSVAMGEAHIIHRSPTQEEAEILDLDGDDQVVELKRVILAENRPVAYLVDIVPEGYLSAESLEHGFRGSVLDLLLQRGDPPLGTSRCEIYAVTAPVEVARALGIQRGDVLLEFVASLYTPQGRIVDYSYSYFLPGYFRFHVIRRVGS